VLAGYVSGAMPQNIGSTPVATNPGYSSVFNMLGWGSLAGGVVLLLLVPHLRQLIASKITPPPAGAAIPV
jgi:POT family proton-dependent oligopeptide transporter